MNYILQIFFGFHQFPITDPRSNPGSHTALSGCVSLISTYMWQFLVFPDCSWPSHYLKINAQVFCRIFLNFGLYIVFALLAWGYEFWGRTQRGEMPFSYHLHISTADPFTYWCSSSCSLGEGGLCQVSPL